MLLFFPRDVMIEIWDLTEGLVDRKLLEAPSNSIAGRPKAALLFWFFGDFRYGVSLFIVILAIYIRLAGGHLYGNSCSSGCRLLCL